MIASFLHLPMYDGDFGYHKKFPKKHTNVIHTHKHHQKQQINKQKKPKPKPKKKRKEKHLEYTTTDLF